MKALIQRVNAAQVVVEGNQVAAIDRGVLAYIGIGADDDLAIAKKLIDKIVHYRIFENPDKAGKMDKSLMDIQGQLLIVSQFTLMANTHSGRRPDFGRAMMSAAAKDLFEQLSDYAKTVLPCVQTGIFGANMQVISHNDGPINFILTVDN